VRQSIRALGWVVTISLILVFAFLASAVYSIFQMAILNRGIGIGDLETEFKDGRLTMTMPISINNTGLYEINEFEITTTLKDQNGTLIATNTTRITEIKHGESRSWTHALSLSLNDLFLRMRSLLFNDTEIKLLISVGIKYAYAFGLKVSMANISIPWGAPLHGLSLKELNVRGFNGTHLFLELILDFENRSFLDVGGSLNLKVYNEDGEQIGTGIGLLYVPAGGRPEKPIPVVVTLSHPESFTGRGYAEVSLQPPISNKSITLGRVEYG